LLINIKLFENLRKHWILTLQLSHLLFHFRFQVRKILVIAFFLNLIIKSTTKTL
jgi:hypothetical protein